MKALDILNKTNETILEEKFHKNIELITNELKVNFKENEYHNYLVKENANFVVQLLDIISLIKISYNNARLPLVKSNGLEELLTDEGKIKLHYTTSNPDKEKLMKDYFKYNLLGKILSNIFEFSLLEKSTNNLNNHISIPENKFNFTINARNKALVGLTNKKSTVSGYIIGDDTGLISTELTGYYTDTNEYGVGFPGVISKRLYQNETLPEILDNFGDYLTTFNKEMLCEQVAKLNEEDYTSCEINSFIIAVITDCIKENKRKPEDELNLFATWSSRGVITTALCAIRSHGVKALYATESINSDILICFEKEDIKTVDCKVTYEFPKSLKDTVGYNELLNVYSRDSIARREIDNLDEYYANALNNPKAMNNLLIKVLQDFYTMAYNIAL